MGARREMLEESGLEFVGDLELVGTYPMWVYGGDCLQPSYRGRVGDSDVVLSHEPDWREHHALLGSAGETP